MALIVSIMLQGVALLTAATGADQMAKHNRADARSFFLASLAFAAASLLTARYL